MSWGAFVQAMLLLAVFLLVGVIFVVIGTTGGATWLLPVVFSVIWVILSLRWVFLILNYAIRRGNQ